MRTFLLLLLAALLVVPAVPALAGSGEKCKADVQSCLDKHAQVRERGWVGIMYEMNDKSQMTVKSVTADSPAEKAGLRAGDVIVALNGVKFSNEEGMKKETAKGVWKPGQQVTYTLLRDGAETPVEVTLGTMPEEVFATMVGLHMIEHHMHASAEAKAEGYQKK